MLDQYRLAALFTICGSLSYRSSKIFLQLCFMSKLCLRATLLSLLVEERTTEISSSSLSIFSSEIRAVSTFRSWSMVSSVSFISRLRHWKEGVLGYRFDRQLPIGLKIIGEGTYLWELGGTKKSGGSFELLILTLRLRAKLWLRFEARISLALVMSYMLEIYIYLM